MCARGKHAVHQIKSLRLILTANDLTKQDRANNPGDVRCSGSRRRMNRRAWHCPGNLSGLSAVWKRSESGKFSKLEGPIEPRWRKGSGNRHGPPPKVGSSLAPSFGSRNKQKLDPRLVFYVRHTEASTKLKGPSRNKSSAKVLCMGAMGLRRWSCVDE